STKPTPDCRSRPVEVTPQVSMPWRFPQTACTWPREASTVRSGCIVRRTARWKRASCQSRLTEARHDAPRVALDGLGVDRLRVEPLGPAGDHRTAAARGAEGQALHADARRQESR